MKPKTQSRCLGRVDDETWDKIKLAAAADKKSFTEWAVAILVKAAAKKAARHERV